MKHLERDIENIHREIMALSALVEEAMDKASQSLCGRRSNVVAELTEHDRIIDKREVHIEEECLKILALHHPVAIDLRRIATVLKVNNDLERIADLAVNIAERAECLSHYPEFPIPERLKRMVDLATTMVRGALDAFVSLDALAAERLCRLDDEVDRHTCLLIEELQTLMQSTPTLVPPGLHCFSAARNVERIADHATNIAEDVIYLVEGEIARHRQSTH